MILKRFKILAFFLCLGSFSQAQQAVSISFDIGTKSSKETQIKTFRFYVSNFQVMYSDGTSEKITRTCHLIDIEDKKSLNILIPTTSDKVIQSINQLFDRNG